MCVCDPHEGFLCASWGDDCVCLRISQYSVTSLRGHLSSAFCDVSSFAPSSRPSLGFPGAQRVKNPPANAGDT